MTSLPSLHSKIEALSLLIAKDSISPIYLASLLDEIVSQIEAIDVSELRSDTKVAVDNATSAIQASADALMAAGSAESSAEAANLKSSTAMENANAALLKAADAFELAQSLQSSLGPGSGATVREFGGFAIGEVVVEHVGTTETGTVVYDRTNKRFVLRVGGLMLPKYYNAWPGASNYSSPKNGSLWIFNGCLYYYNEGVLTPTNDADAQRRLETVEELLETLAEPKDCLTAWQRDYLERQERAEREGKFSAAMSLSPSGSEFTGLQVDYIVAVTARYDGAEVTSSVAVVGSTANLADVEFVSGKARYNYLPPAQSTGRETVSFGAAVRYTDEFGAIEKSVSASQTRYAPMRFLSLAGEAAPTGAQILAASQKYVKASASGDYSVALTPGEYVWVCVPSFMAVSAFSSSGFAVPMCAPVEVAVEIGVTTVTYKCYRTEGTPQSSPMSLTIK